MRIARSIGCSIQTESRAPSLKKTPIQFAEHGDVEVVPTKSVRPCIPEFSKQESILHAIKGKINSKPATNLLSTIV